jgi:elongation factor G
VAVVPATKADLDKMSTALNRIVEEDPTLHLSRSPDTNETLLTGLGEAQIEVAIDKIRRKFGADLKVRLPKVAYKETITQVTQTEYRHKKTERRPRPVRSRVVAAGAAGAYRGLPI